MPMHNNVKHIIEFQAIKIKSFNFSFHGEINSWAINLQVLTHVYNMGINLFRMITVKKH